MIRCYSCNWEGNEENLVEKPGVLIFYDYMMRDALGMDINRVNYLCPSCGEMLRSHRMSNGMVFDK